MANSTSSNSLVPMWRAESPERSRASDGRMGLTYREDSLTKHLMHLPSQKFIK
jgi:hypothetical protein